MTIFFSIVEFLGTYIETLMGCNFVCFLLGKEEKKAFTIMISFIQSFLLLVLQQNKLYSEVAGLQVILVLAISAIVIYKDKFWIGITAAMLFTAGFIGLTELSGLVILSIFTGDKLLAYNIVSQNSFIRSVYILVFKTLQIILYYTIRNKVNQKKIVHEIHKNWKVILPASLFGSVCYSFLANSVLMGINHHVIFNWISLLSILIVCVISIIFYIGYRNSNEKKDLMELKNKMLETNYEDLIKMHEVQEKTAHDLKNHLSILRRYIEEKQELAALDYIGAISAPLTVDNEIWTGNEIVDFILNTKRKEMENKDIDVTIESDIYKLNILDKDINSVLSNLLDNAIQAALQVDEKRWIRIIIKTVNEMLIIKVENNHNHKIVKRGREFITSKKDRKIHGLGIKIVRDIVKKYDGYMDVTYDDHNFLVLLSMPINMAE